MGKCEQIRHFIINLNWFKIALFSFSFVSIGIIGAVFLFYYYHFPILTEDNELWAHFGDFVGGTLSSIFSFFTFIAILYTLHLQREELSLNREELRLNRIELQTANKEAEKQTEIAKIQLDNTKRQKNEEYLLEYMQVYISLESELKHPNYGNKAGAELLDSFFSETIGNIVKVTINNDILEKGGLTLSKKSILKYLNCLEYLVYWDLLQVQDETFNTQPISNHRTFSSKYAPFIKSFCEDKTFIHLSKSGVLLKMNIAAQFPNIVRFF
ncbi:hypothetical protein ND864_17680 [Leptospira levettii]|uniref:hypothetical protein n=1 Tax=Leptospira levettii TaxID=2023178 RepID=UPI00223CACB3|nr:hypothetical protein [Leptospira levettii]MCW7467555.1 hypothetical protein [Leptospira levettii]